MRTYDIPTRSMPPGCYYQRNPFGTTVLINEWVGNCVADIIGLNIPRFGLCNLSESAIINTNMNEEIDKDNRGISFYSEYIPKTTPLKRVDLSKIVNREVERLILFDFLIKDEDRHNGNILCTLTKEPQLYFIDCSHIMMRNRNINGDIDLNEELSNSVILNTYLLSDKQNNPYDLLCKEIGYREDVLYRECSNIKSLITKKELEDIRNSIPDEWVTELTVKRIDDMFTVLRKRLEMIEEISEAIVGERRGQQWKNY